MEVMAEDKKGLKRTEIGLIPSEWTFEEIGPKIDLLSGNPFSSSGYSDYGIRLLRGANIKRGNTQWDDDNTKCWPENDPSLKKYKLKPDDLVIAMDGSLVGRSYAFLSEHDVPSFLLQRVARIRSDKIDTKYLKYFIGSSWFVDYCDSVKTNTAIPHISSTDIKNFKIPLPPTLSEQRAIAEALSDVDELIRSLDGLIQKKQAIKKGTMQQLLTGKKRLPGFDGEWEVISIGELLEFKNGLNKAKEYFGQGTPIINYMDIFRNAGLTESDIKGKVTLSKSEIRRFDVQKGDVFFTRTSETVNEIGISSVLEENIEDGVFSGFILRGRPINNRLSLNFKRYCFRSEPVRKQIIGMATYTTRALTNGRQLSKVKLPVPPSENEQKVIAQILSDMDRELQTLRQKREKYVQIKQGMMRELLMGKVRLVKKETTIHQMPRKRNENFEDAVFIAAVIHRFGSGDFKLNRFRYQKFVYLLKRYVQASIENYMKKAAGPYNPKMRYQGGESIAIKKKYIDESKHKGYDCFIPGNEVEEAIGYFQKWYDEAPLEWLDQLQYSKSGELELITTVDMAMQDILKVGLDADVQSVKELIKTTPKWKKKIKKPEFTDTGIQRVIQKLENTLFHKT